LSCVKLQYKLKRQNVIIIDQPRDLVTIGKAAFVRTELPRRALTLVCPVMWQRSTIWKISPLNSHNKLESEDFSTKQITTVDTWYSFRMNWHVIQETKRIHLSKTEE